VEPQKHTCMYMYKSLSVYMRVRARTRVCVFSHQCVVVDRRRTMSCLHSLYFSLILLFSIFPLLVQHFTTSSIPLLYSLCSLLLYSPHSPPQHSLLFIPHSIFSCIHTSLFYISYIPVSFMSSSIFSMLSSSLFSILSPSTVSPLYSTLDILVHTSLYSLAYCLA